MPRVAGPQAGAEAVRRTLQAAVDHGVEVLTLYAFSSENWRRSSEEIADLTGLMRFYLERELAALQRKGVRLRLIGDYSAFGPTRRAARAGGRAHRGQQPADAGRRAELWFASRDRGGGQGARDKAANGRDRSGSDRRSRRSSAELQTHGLPELDLLIRTSGEVRLSNFLLWQAAYAELMFVDTLWPDFDEQRFRARRSSSSRRASGASVAGERARSSARLTGLILIVAALLAAFQGGNRASRCSSPASRPRCSTNGPGSTRGLGRGLVRRRVLLRAAAGACPAVDPRARAGLDLLLWAFIVTWSTDIGAYFAGRTLRRRKLAPSISPGQDRRRALRRNRGGDPARRRLGASTRPWPRAARAARRCFAVAAQGGDLFESAMKRRAGVKDSRHLAAGTWRRARPARRPGAGGCADRRRAATGADVTRKIAILGATGSVGKSTLDLVERNPDRFEVVAVTAATNVEALADIARRTGAKLAVIADETRLQRPAGAAGRHRLPRRRGRGRAGRSRGGRGGLVMAAIVGCAGLEPVMAAVEAGRTVALANKEALVTAGALMTARGAGERRDPAARRQRA